MQTKRLEKIIITALEELKALDIVIIDVKRLTSVADSMIICTGTSNRHVRSIADNVVEKVKLKKVKPLGVEVDQDSEWILIDFVNIVVHVMQQKTRDFYGLEKLWNLPKKGGKKTT
jgi:ribosome-associated protein